MVGQTIEYAGGEFCGDGCLEEWLDKKQEITLLSLDEIKQMRKYLNTNPPLTKPYNKIWDIKRIVASLENYENILSQIRNLI